MMLAVVRDLLRTDEAAWREALGQLVFTNTLTDTI